MPDTTKVWQGDPQGINQFVADWVAHGAKYVGGCCGVGPKEISAI
ncbi:MAG: homocysteine S-methyltransferase family protein [Actinomycetales bacterium]